MDDLFHQKKDQLFCHVSGEVSELLFTEAGAPKVRATMPVGTHTLLRTLESHGDLSHAEARSLLHLTRHASSPALDIYAEPLAAVGEHFARNLSDILYEVAIHTSPRDVVVVADAPHGEWFARALAEQGFRGDLFPEGSTVRALHTHHLEPHFVSHGTLPDLLLMLEALFSKRGRAGI